MFCSNCGKEYDADAVFCESCGMLLHLEGAYESAELVRMSNQESAGLEGNSIYEAYGASAGETLPMEPVAYVDNPYAASQTVADARPQMPPTPCSSQPDAQIEEGKKAPVALIGAVAIAVIVVIACVVFFVATAEYPTDGEQQGETTEQIAEEPETAEESGAANNSDAQQTEVIEHIVVFETNGGTTYEQLRVLDGAIVTTPTEPARPGYTFEGWFADKDCTLPFEFPHAIEATDPETICVYAKWIEIADNVNDNEAAATNYIEENYGDDAPYYFAIYSDCIFPQSSDEYLSYYDVSGLDMDGAQRAINEIYARNGYIFQSSATERDYFESQPWYYGTETDMNAVTAQFNEYEKENVKLLQDYRASL